MDVRVGLLVGEVTADRGGDWPEIWRACFDLAVEAAVAAGRNVPDVRVLTRAVEGLPTGSASALAAAWHDLAAEGVVAILGPSNADNGRVLVPVAAAGHVPTVLFGCSEQLSSDWTFSVPWGAAPEDAMLAMRWVDRQGLNRVAILWDDAWHAEEWLAYGRLEADRLGIEIVGDTRIPALTMDSAARARQLAAARSGIEAMRRLAPDALVMMTSHGSVPFATALQDASWNIPRVIAGGSFGAARGLPELFDGWVGTSLWDEDNPRTTDLLRRYRSYTGVPARNEDMVIVVYDGSRAVVEALSLAPSPTPSGLRTGLERVKGLPACTGSAASTLSFGPYDHRGYKGPDLSVLRRQSGPSRGDCRREMLA